MVCFHLRRSFRSLVISAGILAAIFLPLVPGIAQRVEPQTSERLREAARCLVTGSTSSSGFWDQEDYDIPIGRQIYTGQFALITNNDDQVTLTCRANPERHATLRLQMGSSDNSVQRGENMKIVLYQSGNVISSYENVAAGDLITTVVDLQNPDFPNPENIAIEMQCSNNSHLGNVYCYLNFVEANLYLTNSYTSGSNADN